MIRTIQRNIVRNQVGGNSKAMSEQWRRLNYRRTITPPAPKKENKSRISRLIAKASRLFNRRRNG